MGALINGSAGLRVDDRQPRAPLQVAHQRRPELGVVGHAHLIRGLEQQTHPTAPLLLREVPIEVLLDHVRVTAVLFRIRSRPAQHFREKRGNVAWMIGTHVREHRREQRCRRAIRKGWERRS
jgi:hypothetical protein